MTRKAVGKAKKSGAKATEKTGKNRRYRNAKISEYRLRKVVECFARDMSVKDTAIATKLSRQSVDIIFTRLRERMRDHGLVKFAIRVSAGIIYTAKMERDCPSGNPQRPP